MQAHSRGRAARRPAASTPQPAPSLPKGVDVEADPRSRLIQGMAEALVQKGYADISVADIVQHARVSKRTFYEHFADKEACYLATYAALSDDVLSRIAAAGQSDLPAEERLLAATDAYLAALEERPALTRTFLTEIQAAGPEALKLRRSIHQRFAELLRHLIERGRKERPGLRSISPQMAAALVGGVNELVLLTIEEGRAQHLREIGATVVELLSAVLLAPAAQRAATPLRRRRTG
jgi:AcrR family transcriptional regulator